MSILGNFKGIPWDYQQEDSNITVAHKGRMLLGHQTGLGKTFISLHALSRLSPERLIITGTNSALSVWLSEVPLWTDGQVQYISRKKNNVEKLWGEAIQKDRPGIWLINHAMFQIMAEKTNPKLLRWDAIIEDEAHKSKNRKTLLHKAMKKIDTNACIMASATPASRGAQDMWAHLNILDPKRFSSYWRFVNRYCYVENSMYGTQIEGTRNKAELKELLKDYYIRRRYEDVKTQLPPLRRQVIELEMTTEQEKVYRQLSDTMMLETEERFILTPGVLSQIQRQRQLALCPRSLSRELPLGSGVEYILDEVTPEDNHVVIFSIAAKVLEVIREELIKAGVKCFSLRGGMEPDEVVEEVRKFKEQRGTMLCTIAFAQSFALDTVDRAYVIGADADPTNNIQAEGRLRRGNSIQMEGVLVKYLIIIGTKEEDFRNIINTKINTVRDFIPLYGD